MITPSRLAPRVLSVAFGGLMVVATQPVTHRLALVAAALAITAVVVGIQFRPAATLAVLITALTLVRSGPPLILAAVCGLSATAYLVLRHTTATQPTLFGAVTFMAVVAVATSLPLHTAWLPLIAPLSVLASYLLATHPFLRDGGRDGGVSGCQGASIRSAWRDSAK